MIQYFSQNLFQEKLHDMDNTLNQMLTDFEAIKALAAEIEVRPIIQWIMFRKTAEYNNDDDDEAKWLADFEEKWKNLKTWELLKKV